MATKLKANEKVNYVENTQFVLDRKYVDLKLIGKGSYGVVCKAKDSSRGMSVAIKKITPMAKTVVDAKHVLREVRIMRHMGKHENIITIEDIIVREANDELYIIMELFDSDLHQVIQSSQVLTEQHHRHFMHQLLCGVKYLHDNRIIHRDLKPGNLLVSRNCALRITDFGLARERPMSRVLGDDPSESIDEPMTEHVITRWYRPPELMLCPDGLYTYAVDIWSCGCIFAEMIKRKAIFPGKNFIDQLSKIFDVIGSPNALEIAHIENQEAIKFLDSQKTKKKISFHKFLPGVPTPAVGLIEGMLQFDPSNRLVINEILLSPYFTNVPRTSKSLVFPPTAPDFSFEFERQNLTKYQLRQLIVAEPGLLKKQQQSSASEDGEHIAKDQNSVLSVDERRPSNSGARDVVGMAHVMDKSLPEPKYDSAKDLNRNVDRIKPSDWQKTQRPAGPADDSSDAPKPSARSSSNPRASRHHLGTRAVSKPQEADENRRRSNTGLRTKKSETETKATSERPTALRPKEPFPVDDDLDAAIEEDYHRAKSWLGTQNISKKELKSLKDPIASDVNARETIQTKDHVPVMRKQHNSEDSIGVDKYREYQEYQKQLQAKYKKLNELEHDHSTDISGHSISSNEAVPRKPDPASHPSERSRITESTKAAETQSKLNRDSDVRPGRVLHGSDFEVDLASESVISNGATHGRGASSTSTDIRSRPTARNESKYDSDEDSVDVGPSRVVPAPVPYPKAVEKVISSSAVPPSPSRLHKHAMSLLEDKNTTDRAMSYIVSNGASINPAAPDSPSKSNSTQYAQTQRRAQPLFEMSGFGETSGAKGRQQPVPVVASTAAAANVVIREPPSIHRERNVQSSDYTVGSPSRAVITAAIESRSYLSYDTHARGGIALKPRHHVDEDLRVVEHEASEMSIKEDRPLFNGSNNSSVKNFKNVESEPFDYLTKPPPAPQANVVKSAKELEQEKAEARLKARKLTVPKSPKFSQMSWQRRGSGEQDVDATAMNNRSVSAPRRATIGDSSKSRLATSAAQQPPRRHHNEYDSDDTGSGEDRNLQKKRNNKSTTSNNLPNYAKPRSESAARLRGR